MFRQTEGFEKGGVRWLYDGVRGLSKSTSNGVVDERRVIFPPLNTRRVNRLREKEPGTVCLLYLGRKKTERSRRAKSLSPSVMVN